jgi:hypothetical protein
MSEIDDLNERAAEFERQAENLREEASRLWWIEEHARRKREGYEPSPLERMLLADIKRSLAHPPLLSKIEWLERSESPIITRMEAS